MRVSVVLLAAHVFADTGFVAGGEGFVEIGEWRFGSVDDGKYFAFSHETTGKTAVAFSEDGRSVLPPLPEHGLGGRAKLLSGSDVTLGDRFVEFAGKWRLGEAAKDPSKPDSEPGQQLALSNLVSGKTAYVWRRDGALLPGPRDDFGLSAKLTANCLAAAPGLLSISRWYIAESGEWDTESQGGLAIVHVDPSARDQAVVVYEPDGKMTYGPLEYRATIAEEKIVQLASQCDMPQAEAEAEARRRYVQTFSMYGRANPSPYKEENESNIMYIIFGVVGGIIVLCICGVLSVSDSPILPEGTCERRRRHHARRNREFVKKHAKRVKVVHRRIKIRTNAPGGVSVQTKTLEAGEYGAESWPAEEEWPEEEVVEDYPAHHTRH